MEDKMINIKAGDIVKPKSGGPKMTVERIVPDSSGNTEGSVQCCWFNKDDEVKANEFGLETLMPVQEHRMS
jgi:uncharacterized protein YodC (DUF2158 family)